MAPVGPCQALQAGCFLVQHLSAVHTHCWLPCQLSEKDPLLHAGCCIRQGLAGPCASAIVEASSLSRMLRCCDAHPIATITNMHPATAGTCATMGPHILAGRAWRSLEPPAPWPHLCWCGAAAQGLVFCWHSRQGSRFCVSCTA